MDTLKVTRLLVAALLLSACAASSVPDPGATTLANGNVEHDGDAGFVNPPDSYDHDGAAVNPASIPPDPCMYDSGIDAAACVKDGGNG